jgi:hypothetical protein
MQYLRARYYDPAVGRFVSRDVWEGLYFYPSSMNRWMYVGGNPINRIDPSGFCYTNPNILSSGYWERFLESPILGPCSSESSVLPPPRITTVTQTPTACPIVVLPTITPSSENGHWEEFGDNWTISHYVTAMENDPYFLENGPYKYWIDPTGYIPGLDQNKKYNLNWVYADRGVIFQGQGLSNDNEYITKDYDKTERVTNPIFRYGKGGKYGPPREWATVATGDPRLKPHDWVRIAAYPEKGPFEVLDIGEYVGNSHLDVFIGDKFFSEADALGTKQSRVSILRK